LVQKRNNNNNNEEEKERERKKQTKRKHAPSKVEFPGCKQIQFSSVPDSVAVGG
jgi:hypothetical protein